MITNHAVPPSADLLRPGAFDVADLTKVTKVAKVIRPEMDSDT